MPSKLCESDGEIAFLVRFVFIMGCAKEVYYRPTSLMCRPYMDDLSRLLNCCNTGCMSGGTIINHLMYADDLVLISPSATGMKELLCACEVYSLEHAIVYTPRTCSKLTTNRKRSN